MILTLMIGMFSRPPLVSGPASYQERSCPEGIVLGSAVAENRSSSLDDFAVPPGQPMDHVDVEAAVRLAGAIPGVAGDVGRKVVRGHQRRSVHTETVVRQAADRGHELKKLVKVVFPT